MHGAGNAATRPQREAVAACHAATHIVHGVLGENLRRSPQNTKHVLRDDPITENSGLYRLDQDRVTATNSRCSLSGTDLLIDAASPYRPARRATCSVVGAAAAGGRVGPAVAPRRGTTGPTQLGRQLMEARTLRPHGARSTPRASTLLLAKTRSPV